MAIDITNKPNTEPAGGDYEFNQIRDETSPGAGDGTPVNKLVYDDFHQTFAKLIDLSQIIYNNLPDNLTNGYQYVRALFKLFVQNDPTGPEISTSIVSIGNWDMQTNATFDLDIGISLTKIHSIEPLIFGDIGISGRRSSLYNAGGWDEKVGTPNTIVLFRDAGGQFDSANYNSAIAGIRGKVIVRYDPT